MGVMRGLWKNFVVEVCSQQAQFTKFTEKAMACLDEGGGLWSFSRKFFCKFSS